MDRNTNLEVTKLCLPNLLWHYALSILSFCEEKCAPLILYLLEAQSEGDQDVLHLSYLTSSKAWLLFIFFSLSFGSSGLHFDFNNGITSNSNIECQIC